MDFHRFGDRAEALVFRPQNSGRIEENRGHQVHISQANSEAVEATRLDHLPQFIYLGDANLRQQVEQG